MIKWDTGRMGVYVSEDHRNQMAEAHVKEVEDIGYVATGNAMVVISTDEFETRVYDCVILREGVYEAKAEPPKDPEPQTQLTEKTVYVEVDKSRYRITFQYIGTVTECQIVPQNKYLPWAFKGTTYLSPRDTYKRSIGEKNSLARALDHLTPWASNGPQFDREFRTEFWDAVKAVMPEIFR